MPTINNAVTADPIQNSPKLCTEVSPKIQLPYQYEGLIFDLTEKLKKDPLFYGSIILFCTCSYYIMTYYIPIDILICFGICFMSIGFLIYYKVDQMHRQVIITKFSKKTQETLLEKSVFDLLCDFWYFPGISRYIKPLIKPLFTGEGPEITIKSFDSLSPEFKHAIMRKGVIHIFPNWVKKFIQPYESFSDLKLQNKLKQQQQHQQQQNNIVTQYIPPLNGNNTLYTTDNRNIKQQQKNIVKTSKFDMSILKEEIKFKEIKNKLKRDEIINKYSRLDEYKTMKEEKEKQASFSSNTIQGIFKFINGSKYVSKKDKKIILQTFFTATLVLGAVLAFRKGSRQTLKNTIFTIITILALSVSSGSFLLIGSYYRNSRKQINNNNKN